MSVTREYIAAGKKRVNHIRARWLGDESFEAGRPDRPSVRIDGHGVSGPGPVEVLLGALASCGAIDVVQILEKRRTPVSALEVDVQGERADSIPARLVAIRMHFHITGEGIELEQARRAVELSVNRYCSVRDSIDPAIPIELSLDVKWRAFAGRLRCKRTGSVMSAVLRDCDCARRAWSRSFSRAQATVLA
jgi:putative redox protein